MTMSKSVRKFLKEETKKSLLFHVDADVLKPSESAFVQRAHERMMIVHRPSWPDFIVCGDDGEIFGVEVKSGKDSLSVNQIRTFDVLTELGQMKIFLWDADQPDKLIPWSKVKREKRRFNGRKKPA